MSVLAYLAELVAMDSVSALPNRGITEWLRARLEPLGFAVELRAHRDEKGVEKVNLLARHGPRRDGGLALVAHTDTVPYDPAWSEALCLTEREGKLFGRGAVDTKPGLACALAAVESVPLGDLKEPLWIVATADEEVGCLGARRLMEEHALQPHHALVAEPTRMIPIRAHKGYWAAEVVVRGKEGHSAYPHTGDNAIFKAARLITRLEHIAAEIAAEHHPHFDPPFCSINIGTISGGKARNVIPGECSFPVEWRPLPGQDASIVEERLKQEVEPHGTFTMVRRDPAAETAPDAPLVRCLEELTGQPAGTIPFGTELPYLNGLGAQSVVFGPGDITVAHQTGEFVPRDELEEALRVYRETVRRMAF